jgi:VWFA-related protein
MVRSLSRWLAVGLTVTAVAALGALRAQDLTPRQSLEGQRPVFRTGVDLVHVTATVTDSRGHFVRGLGKDDFRISEDGESQPIVQFSAERAPVSIGFALDTSSSMAGTKIREAKEALRRVMDDLLEGDDEVFLYTFSDTPLLRQNWTTDRRALREALEGVNANGRTALYDTVDQALRLLETGKYRKKVLLVVSDGNDTASFTPLSGLRARIRESEAMVYAIGVDSDEQRLLDGVRRVPRPPSPQLRPPQRPPIFPPRPPIGKPGPDPGGGRPPWAPPPAPTRPVPQSDAANVQALRELTDISGGRTEVVRSSSDIGPATASVADELSRQYQLVYQATSKRDGRWHAIVVSVRDASFQVRARKGYTAGKE